MIFIDAPREWKNLEMRVCQILSECGCRVERGKHLRLPRGGADIDVYAEDLTREPHIVIVCECKHWKTRVPKSTIHSFRTVMSETGAHVGFIVSSMGFQSGAIEAVKNTNIELVT
jgi:predicted helicase